MRPLPTAVLLVVAAIIVTLTLAPIPDSVERLPTGCFYCSARATADAIANVILFLPLGVAFAWARPDTRAWPWGLALSLGIELLQRWIPGRDPAVGDVLTNTLGIQIGWWLARYVAVEHRRVPPARAAYVASAGFVVIVAAVVWLLGPAPTSDVYYGGWTPLLGHVEWYRGRVLSATVNHVPLAVGPLPDAAPVRQFVMGHGTVDVRALAGPSVSGLAPLVSVFDQRQREVLLIGPDRYGLALRYRRRAANLRFDQPYVRLDGAFAGLARGDTFAVTAERGARRACLSLGTRTACMPVATPGRGWSLVDYPEAFSTGLRRALDALWIGGLALLVGWYAGWRRRLAGVGAIALGALVVLPLLGSIAPSPPTELGAAAFGLVVGALVRRALAHDRLGQLRDAAIDPVI
jgi:hypothetical protein